MASYQDSKTIQFQLGVISTSATSATTVDTLGFKRALVEVFMSKATNGSSNAKWTKLKLQHGTTTDASNFTNVSGAVGTTEATATSSQFVLPIHNDTVESGVIRFNVDLTGKARHLRIEKQAPASHHTSANSVTLWRGNSSPDSAGDAGLDAIVFV